jgi:GTPase SAR1 family protein
MNPNKMPFHAPALSAWCLWFENMDNINNYINRRTIIVGDVNSGKTSYTLNILKLFLKTGYAGKIAILDLAPDNIQGIGGKMEPPQDESLLYLTTSILAPRLTGKDEHHTLKLAEKNATTIEKLFTNFFRQKREILFVNDVTLYFQAGDFEHFIKILDTASTHIINAYYGHTFSDSELTRREKNLTEELMKLCDQIIEMPL